MENFPHCVRFSATALAVLLWSSSLCSADAPASPTSPPGNHAAGVHVLTIDGGTGSASSGAQATATISTAAKSKVKISADAIPAGKFFDHWQVAPRSLKIGKTDLSDFVLSMPDSDTSLTAVLGDVGSSKITRVACVGDSITEITGYPNYLRGMLPKDQYDARNFGVSSTTAVFKSDKPYYKEPTFHAAKDFRPNIVVIMLGTNDTRKSSPNTYQFIADFVPDYEKIIGEFSALEPTPKVFICRPTPIYNDGNWGLNEPNLEASVLPGVDKIAGDLHLSVIDVYTALSNHPEWFHDNIHPGGDGAKMIAATVYKAITGNDPPASKK
jgi:acyl-CoA thioesterase I